MLSRLISVNPVPLSGNPRTGALDLGAPRKPYTLTLERSGTDIIIRATGTFPSTGILRRTQAHFEAPVQFVGWVRIDLYDWKIVVDEAVKVLEVFDTPQRKSVERDVPFSETMAAVFSAGE
jgi:hypothetical protein